MFQRSLHRLVLTACVIYSCGNVAGCAEPIAKKESPPASREPAPEVLPLLNEADELLKLSKPAPQVDDLAVEIAAMRAALGDDAPWKKLVESAAAGEARNGIVNRGLQALRSIRDFRYSEKIIIANEGDPLETAWRWAGMAMRLQNDFGQPARAKEAAKKGEDLLIAAVKSPAVKPDAVRLRRIRQVGSSVVYSLLLVGDEEAAKRIRDLAKSEHTQEGFATSVARARFATGDWKQFPEKLALLSPKARMNLLYSLWHFPDYPLDKLECAKLLKETQQLAQEIEPKLSKDGQLAGGGLNVNLPQIMALAYAANHDWKRALAETEKPGWAGTQPPSTWEAILNAQVKVRDLPALQKTRDALATKLAATKDVREQRYLQNLMVGCQAALGKVDEAQALQSSLSGPIAHLTSIPRAVVAMGYDDVALKLASDPTLSDWNRLNMIEPLARDGKFRVARQIVDECSEPASKAAGLVYLARHAHLAGELSRPAK